MTGRPVLEICCDSLRSALAAESGGADRIELCACLELGGVTPGGGLLERVIGKVSIPVFAMVRPRAGDFIYSDEEMEVMLADIAYAKSCGATGIVCGPLKACSRSVDFEMTRALVNAAGDLPFTFHRAFEQVAEQEKELEMLADVGVCRVLTSGGLSKLTRLQQGIGDRLTILACGGIRSGNLGEMAAAGDVLREYHSAALTESSPTFVDEKEVRAMADILKAR